MASTTRTGSSQTSQPINIPIGENREGSESGQGDKKTPRVPAGLAVSADGKSLWAANAFGHTLARFDTESEIPGGRDRARTRLVPLRIGARRECGADLREPLGRGEGRGRRHQDERTPEPLRDPRAPQRDDHREAGAVPLRRQCEPEHGDRPRHQEREAIETINTAIAPQAPAGSTPSSLSLTPDESILLVANANTNDVAAFNVKEPGKSTPLGFIPVGWYPTSVRASRDGKTLWVTNGKGGSSRANRDGPRPGFGGGAENRTRQYIGGPLLGTLSTIPMPSPRQMAEYSRTVYACSPIKKDDPAGVTGPEVGKDNPVPRKVGEPSPITHCIYIIKENRTYDQIFGDMPEGNGEPSLCLFPEKVTPNHHALAREFVLLDNFYVESEVSADGHEWTMGAYATDFVERTWPLGYRGDNRVPYPSEGDSPSRPRPVVTSGTARPPEGSRIGAMANSSRMARLPRIRRTRTSRHSKAISTRSIVAMT